MSRSPPISSFPLLAGTILLLAACGSCAAAGNGNAKVDSVQSAGLPGEHVQRHWTRSHLRLRTPG